MLIVTLQLLVHTQEVEFRSPYYLLPAVWPMGWPMLKHPVVFLPLPSRHFVVRIALLVY